MEPTLPKPNVRDLPHRLARTSDSDTEALLALRTGFRSEAEERRVLAWLNAGLRPHRPGRLQREYPFLFGPDSAAIPVTGYVAGRPTAFCVLWPSAFRIGEGTFRIGLISLVYTTPADRGRGHASKIIDFAMQVARKESLGCVALWSDLDRLYQNLGFVESGRETLLTLDANLLAQAQAETINGVRQAEFEISAPQVSDWNAIETLRTKRQCERRLSLSPRLLEAIPDMKIRVARRRNQIVAFAMRGRGDDFRNVIHEWGGETPAVLQCCEALTGEDPLTPSTYLLGPSDRDDVVWALRRAGAPFSTQTLAWFQLADTNAFVHDLSACLGDELGWEISEVDSDAADPRLVQVRCVTTEVRIPLRTFLDGCLGTPSFAAQSEALHAIAPLFSNMDSIPLPLPLFISGLESI